MLHFDVKADARGEWRWTLRATNGEPIAVSSEGYVMLEDCLHCIDLVRGTNSSTPIRYPGLLPMENPLRGLLQNPLPMGFPPSANPLRKVLGD